jgi:hypothetical protein
MGIITIYNLKIINIFLQIFVADKLKIIISVYFLLEIFKKFESIQFI